MLGVSGVQVMMNTKPVLRLLEDYSPTPAIRDRQTQLEEVERAPG